MEIVQNAALRMTLPSEIAGQIVNKINRAEVTRDQGSYKEVLVCWDDLEARALASIIDELPPDAARPQIPAPILRDYAWPGIHRPFAHQKATAAFLSIRQRAHCFSEPGTGKTSAAIWAADYLMKIGAIRRVLVICPLSIMDSAWKSDIFKTAMHRSAAVAHGSAATRAKIVQSNYDFVIINFDGVEVVKNEIAASQFDLIIVDEANAYKSPTTKRWKTLARLITPRTWLWMMTGTPAAQSPVDAYGLARLVAPHRVTKTMTAWKDRVMTQITRFKWVPKPQSNAEVYNALQPAIRYTKAECLDLPPLTYQTRDIPLTAQASKYYKQLKTQMLIEAAGQSVSAVNAATMLSKLMQVSCGAVYTDKGRVLEFDVGPRLKVLEEVLDETPHKVVVFVPFLHAIDIVVGHLKANGHAVSVIRGDVSAKDRADIIKKFQTEADPRVLVIQPQSASHGVTLTAADTIVFWGPVMSVETFLQCVGRIDRVGQVNKTTIVMLEGSDVERKVYKALRSKVDNHLDVVGLYKSVFEEE